MFKKQIILVALSLFSLAISFTSVRASSEIVSVPILDQNHYIRTDEGTTPYLENVVDLVRRSIETYDPIFMFTTPTIFIDLVPPSFAVSSTGTIVDGEAQPRSAGDADLLFAVEGVSPDTAICWVKITDIEIENLDYVIPHEIAHCYQFFNTDFFLNENAYELAHAWWVEGTAEWLSSLVEPLGAGESTLQSQFASRKLQSINKHEYDAFYFWAYLSSTLGNDLAINLIRDMPSDPTTHLDFLSRRLRTDMDTWFHGYVQAVSLDELPYLTRNLEELAYYNGTIDGLPVEQMLWAEPFGIGIANFFIALDETQGFLVDVSNLSDSGLTVSIFTNSDFIELNETESIELCDASGFLTVVWSRTDGGVVSSEPNEARLNFNPSETCEAETISPYRVTAWRATYTDEAGIPMIDSDAGEEEAIDTAFLEYEDSLISVWNGGDFIYTGSPESGYSGTFLVTDPDIDVTTVLTFIDEDTRFEVRYTTLFGTEYAEYVTYARTDYEIEIWSENARSFLDASMINTCLGKNPGMLGFAYTMPDLLMPFRFQEDGTVLMDEKLYVGGEHEATNSSPFITIVTRRSLALGEGSIGFRLQSIADGRDDCQLIYESNFRPFDEDFEALFATAAIRGGEPE